MGPFTSGIMLFS